MKQIAKLVKVRYVEDITNAERVGKPAFKLSPAKRCKRCP